MTESQRVMIIAHGHPDLSPGGGENAAYALFRGLRDQDDVEALFVARDATGAGDGATFVQYARDGSEILFGTNAEFKRFSQRQHHLVYRDFRGLLEWFRPTVVHFHHYVHIGLEFIREVRNYSADVSIVLTLHEFLAMCYANGQMVKPDSGRLCSAASATACHQCFPDISRHDFFLRESYIKSFLGLVDAYVAPSAFLMQRYIDWGLPGERFVQIENGLTELHGSNGRKRRAGNGRRLGFFGQIIPHKGLDVVLEALDLLPRSLTTGSDPVTLHIHGSRLSEQEEGYRKRITKLLEKVGDRAHFHGPYAQADLPWLMDRVDWVVLPSTWWENSPVVIQEAFANGVPVICSGIGGMAEKVGDHINGLHFHVRDPQDLADKIEEAVTTPGLLDQLRAGVPHVPTATEVAARHKDLYQELIERHRTRGQGAAPPTTPDEESVGARGPSKTQMDALGVAIPSAGAPLDEPDVEATP